MGPVICKERDMWSLEYTLLNKTVMLLQLDIVEAVSRMNDSLFVSLDRLLLEFVFQYEQDVSTKEDMIQRINKCFEDIKENKATICKIQESINATDEEIGHYYKHSKVIKDNCSNSSELKKEVDEVEIEINYLNQRITRLYETKNFSETLEEKNKTIEKRKELKERIFEKDEHLLILNKTPQNSQLFLPYESQKLVRPIKMHSSEPRVTDKEKESSVKPSKLANIDLRQKENDTQVFNDSAVNNNSKCSHITAIKSSQNFMQFRLLTPQKQSNCNQWFEKGDTDAECGDKGTRQLTESSCPSQVVYAEQLGKPIDNNKEVEERAENFPQTPEVPLFLRTPEAVKTPESLEKLVFPKTPSFEINRNIMPEGQTQKESPALSFVMSYASRSPGLNLFDSSVFDTETSSDQFNEHYSARNLNPVSSQQEIGNLFGKPEGEDAFTFSFPSDSSAHTFEAGKDDFSFPFSFEQEQNSAPFSAKGFSSSSRNTTQFTFF
ncbi:Protein SIX6OS1 [Manis javanica]|nr:Protein SIX6OS1 [Manis javanica]